MIDLDTHVVVWLHAGSLERLTPPALGCRESVGILVSRMVVLELQYR